jgi:RimJ/RimL family protein N-acetyltransferase
MKEDLQQTIIWRNDPYIKLNAMMHPYPVTEENEDDWYHSTCESKNPERVYFAIVTANDKMIIGYTFLKDINYIHGTCYFGIVIGNESNRHQGYGEETLDIMTKYAFDILNLRKIYLKVIEDNKAAIILYKKRDFKEEGCLKEYFYFEGNYHDVFIMSLTRNYQKGPT